MPPWAEVPAPSGKHSRRRSPMAHGHCRFGSGSPLQQKSPSEHHGLSPQAAFRTASTTGHASRWARVCGRFVVGFGSCSRWAFQASQMVRLGRSRSQQNLHGDRLLSWAGEARVREPDIRSSREQPLEHRRRIGRSSWSAYGKRLHSSRGMAAWSACLGDPPRCKRSHVENRPACRPAPVKGGRCLKHQVPLFMELAA